MDWPNTKKAKHEGTNVYSFPDNNMKSALAELDALGLKVTSLTGSSEKTERRLYYYITVEWR